MTAVTPPDPTAVGARRGLPNGDFGMHMIVDWQGSPASIAKVRDHELVTKFTHALVDRIRMSAYGGPWVHRFAEHDPALSGITLFQPIETSAITAHLVDIDGNGHLDVFSCAPFMAAPVFDTVDEFFTPTRMRGRVLPRTAPTSGPARQLIDETAGQIASTVAA